MRDVDRGFTQISADEVKRFTVHPEREAVEGRAIGSGQSASSVHPERAAPLRQAQGNRLRAIGFLRSS